MYQVYVMFPGHNDVPTMHHCATVKTWYEAEVALNKQLDVFFPHVDRSVAIVSEKGLVLYQVTQPKSNHLPVRK